MTTDTKLDALRVAENIHMMLRILRAGSVGYTLDKYGNQVLTVAVVPREWHQDLQRRYQLHPAIDKLIQTHRPHDWHQLVLEYPHQAESDRTRIAYTQSERKGLDNIQTVTSLAKYIRRHFPQLGDHVIRDTVAAYSVTGCKIVRNTDEMIYHIERGPSSCMVRSGWNVDTHPYRVYDPALGWGLAVRIEGDDVVGRALVNDNTKTYVRTYLKRETYSHSDHDLEAWLQEQGYTKASDWCGLDFKYIRSGDTFVAPYIDGDTKRAEIYTLVGGTQVVRITEDGAYECDQTGGYAHASGDLVCEDCSDRTDDGDGYWVGRSEDTFVCSSCCDNNYYYAYGRRGNRYYLHDSCVVHVDGEVFDEDYLDDNNIVELNTGDYTHMDNAVYVESNDTYYESDDEDVCYDDYNSRYELREDCVQLEDGTMCHTDDAWQCHASDDYYTNDVEYVEIDGCTYHPDHAPATEDESTTEGE